MREAIADFFDNFFDEYPWVLWTLIIAAVIGAFIGIGKMSESEINRRCSAVMAMARTPHDSLEAKITCEKIRSDVERDIAISTAAGAAAAAYSGSRR